MSIDTKSRANHSAQGTEHGPEDSSSVGSLLSQLGHDVGSLVSTEVKLANAEISDSLRDTKKGAISLATATVVLFAGLINLLNGLARKLTAVADIQAWISFLVVGGVVSIISGVLLARGKSKLSADNLALTHTEASPRQDQRVAKEQLS